MKFLIDMNLSPRWKNFLSLYAVSGVHWSELGMVDASDIEIMHYARQHDFIVLTNDLDFGAILAINGRDKPSVVQIRADNLSPESIGVIVVEAILKFSDELAGGALLTIEPQRFRARLLPLR